jgi:succinate dehydrogenase/fumarate reductase flavoprotein subunit
VKAKTTDVLVLGAGPGGMSAAVAAAQQGAVVTVLEALGEIGGNAIWSTGYMAFVDTDFQRQQGIHDSVESFMNDARAEVNLQRNHYGIIWDEYMTRVYAEQSARTYDFLVQYGVEFGRLIERPLQHTTARMLNVVDTFSIQRAYLRAFEEHGVTVEYNTKATRLVRTGNSITGVEAHGPDGLTSWSAKRAVILATGGYQANPELRLRYQPEHLARTPYLGVHTCQGDGHIMGQSQGGDLINMTMIQPLVIVGSALVEDSIAVNSTGRRFHDEAGPYDDRVAALLVQPDRIGYYVFDHHTFQRKQHLVNQMPAPYSTADDIHGLADLIGSDVGTLAATVESWNVLVAASPQLDADFGRVIFNSERHGISEPPYYCSRMTLGTNFPSGGLRTTTAMAVVDVMGQSIPGLYAAGDTVGGVNPCLGLGGIHICSGLTLGTLAGQSAANGVVGEVHELLRHEPLARPKLITTRPVMAIVDLDETTTK